MKAVAIIDPWNNEWGGVCGGRRWLSYPTLQTQCVNSTCDQITVMSPLVFTIIPKWNSANNFSFDIEIGFYIPRGTVMDIDSWAITEVFVDCILPESWSGRHVDYSLTGRWIVGEKIKLSLPIKSNPSTNGEVKLCIKAIIEGNRPYEFKNSIEAYENISVNIENGIELKHYQLAAI